LINLQNTQSESSSLSWFEVRRNFFHFTELLSKLLSTVSFAFRKVFSRISYLRFLFCVFWLFISSNLEHTNNKSLDIIDVVCSIVCSTNFSFIIRKKLQWKSIGETFLLNILRHLPGTVPKKYVINSFSSASILNS
jgi:hypothetical protein